MVRHASRMSLDQVMSSTTTVAHSTAADGCAEVVERGAPVVVAVDERVVDPTEVRDRPIEASTNDPIRQSTRSESRGDRSSGSDRRGLRAALDRHESSGSVQLERRGLVRSRDPDAAAELEAALRAERAHQPKQEPAPRRSRHAARLRHSSPTSLRMDAVWAARTRCCRHAVRARVARPRSGRSSARSAGSSLRPSSVWRRSAVGPLARRIVRPTGYLRRRARDRMARLAPIAQGLAGARRWARSLGLRGARLDHVVRRLRGEPARAVVRQPVRRRRGRRRPVRVEVEQ